MVTIDILPDDVLLKIFAFCMERMSGDRFAAHMNERIWRRTIHVCRRWRRIIFASPRRLDLQILCADQTRVKEMLDDWQTIPNDMVQLGVMMSRTVAKTT